MLSRATYCACPSARVHPISLYRQPLGHCHCADGAGGGPGRQAVGVPGSSEALETWPWVFLGLCLRLFAHVWFA